MASASVIFDVVGRDRASGTFDKVGNSADRSGSKMAKFGKVAKFAALGVAAGAGAAAVGLFKLAKGAAEDEAGQKRLARALQNSAGATRGQVAGVEDWITAQGKALGVADDQLRPALENLAGATHDVGKAQKLASLAMDVAAGKNMSLEAVSKTLAKAQLTGNVKALAKLGISTKDAKGETISFEEATKRLAALHKGQASEAANTTAGKFGRLKLMLSETGESIGAKLLPIGIKLADWFLKKGVPALSAFGDYLGQKLPPIFAKVKAVVGTVLGALRGDVASNLGGIKETFASAVSIIRSLWGAFGGNIVQYMRAAFTNARIILKGAFTVIRGIFKTVSALLRGDWKGVWEGIKTILRGAVQILVGVVRQLFNLIRFSFKNAGVVLRGIFRGIWDGIKSIAKAGADKVVDGIKAIPGLIKGAAGAYMNAGKSLMGKLVDGFKAVGKLGLGIGKNLFNGIRSGINSAIDGVNDFLPNKIGLKGLPDIDLPDNPIPRIPALASGGRVTRDSIVRIGEREPETVLRDRDIKSLLKKARAAGAGPRPVASSGTTVVNQLTVNIPTGFVGSEDQLVQSLEQMMIRVSRNRGRALQIPVAS